MNIKLENDLKKCLELISADWVMQNNLDDQKTNYIYKAETLERCLQLINENNGNKDYALHRWYNYMTSVYCEYLFCDYGAIHEKDIYNHDVDIYINEIPFDVKLTIYPAKLKDRPFDLKKRSERNKMIEWYYLNQSQQSRKQLLNRIYVVCDGKDANECLRMKSDFSLLRTKIKNFMEYINCNGFNEVDIIDNNMKYTLKSDIIHVKYD